MTGQARSLLSPVGRLRVMAEAGRIRSITWSDEAVPPAGGDEALLDEAEAQLAAYFAGRLKRFDLPLAPRGTAYENRVWQAIAAIPYGEWRSYGELARGLGSLARAVGRACGANPIPIVVPCHRVLARGGALGGFSGGRGLATKTRLLELEGARPGVLL